MMTIEDMTGEELDHLLSQTMRPQGAAARRRKEFRDRFAIMTDEYDYLIKERIVDTHQLSETQMDMCKWAVGFFNPMKRIVRRLAVAYKRRPRRRLEGATDEQLKTWAAMYRAVRFDARAKHWQQYSVAMNTIVILVVPRVNEFGKPVIDFEMVTGAIAEVHREPGTPMASPPGVLCYQLPPREWMSKPGEAACVTVDARWWIWWDAQKQPVRIIEHGFEMFPGSTMRSTVPPDDDYWDPHTGRGVTRTVAEVGMIAASMGWTRKTQCRYLMAMISEEESDEVPEGQVLTNPEQPIVASGAGIKIVVEDLDKAVDNFLKHIRALQDEAAEIMTGAVSTLVDPDPQLSSVFSQATGIQHAAVEEIRESQLDGLDGFEDDMGVALAIAAQAIGHEHAVPVELVRTGQRRVWPRLPSLDTPMERVKVWEEETSFGISDQVEAVMEREGLSAPEAEKRLMEIAERRARLDAFRASRNQKKKPDGDPTTLEENEEQPGEQLAALQGRAGGQASGEARA